MSNTILGIKMALLGAAISAPIGVVAGHWDNAPVRTEHVRVILDGARPAHDYPQFNGDDRRFIVDPDSEQDDQDGTDDACAPGTDECWPDDPADAVYRT
jgi:hypothetical protein